eukprot:jgi/Mesen1/8075/ME000433S07370
MGLLDKLWDDTIGGPQPEKGVGKLRKIDIPGSPRLGREDSFPVGSPFSDSEDEAMRIMLDRRRSADFQRGQEEAKRITQSISIAKPLGPPRSFDRSFDRSTSLPASFGQYSPNSPTAMAMSPATRERENVWRSVFHPGSNKVGMDRLGASKFDNTSAAEKSPTVYDWYNRLD